MTTRHAIEVSPCRLLPGWLAFVYCWTSRGREIYHVCFSGTADAAYAAAEIWLERLRRLGELA